MPSKTNSKVLDFQKWLKAKYPNVDLGAFGANKDGIDGIMGAKTKALFDKYGSEFSKEQEISPLTSIGTKKITIPDSVRDLVSGKKSSVSAIDKLLAEKESQSVAQKTGKDLADAEMIKNRGITD